MGYVSSQEAKQITSILATPRAAPSKLSTRSLQIRRCSFQNTHFARSGETFNS